MSADDDSIDSARRDIRQGFRRLEQRLELRLPSGLAAVLSDSVRLDQSFIRRQQEIIGFQIVRLLSRSTSSSGKRSSVPIGLIATLIELHCPSGTCDQKRDQRRRLDYNNPYL